ncbi:MAG: N-acetylmuramoyl-L-alanine amidase [Cellulosilyticaceae bacterium]
MNTRKIGFIIGLSMFYLSAIKLYAMPREVGDIPVSFIQETRGTINMHTVLLNGRSCISHREVAEKLGAIVEYKDYEKKVYIFYEDTLLVLPIGEKIIWRNGENLLFDDATVMVENDAMIPINVLRQGLGVEIEDDNQTIIQNDDETIKYMALGDYATVTLTKADGLRLSDIQIEDGYREREIRIKINKFYEANFPSHKISINDNYLSEIAVTTDYFTQIVLKEQKVQAVKLREDETNIYIDLVSPHQKYDKIIFLDPGHGGNKPGSMENGIIEKELNLKQALAIRDLIEKNTTVKVYMSREDDKPHYLDNTEELLYRSELANEIGADYFISIHNNSATTSSAKGTEVHYHQNNKQAQAVAQIVQENMVASCHTKDRKIKPRTDLIVLNYTKMPAVLIETGFLSNKDEARYLKSEEVINHVAEAVLKSIQLIL